MEWIDILYNNENPNAVKSMYTPRVVSYVVKVVTFLKYETDMDKESIMGLWDTLVNAISSDDNVIADLKLRHTLESVLDTIRMEYVSYC